MLQQANALERARGFRNEVEDRSLFCPEFPDPYPSDDESSDHEDGDVKGY
jgi:hypothetical protein